MKSVKATGIYLLIRRVLFFFNPETAHDLTFFFLKYVQKLRILSLFSFSKKFNTPVQVMGISFPNRLGLAAGLDKDGVAIQGLSQLGFGFVEVGTVTPNAQPGNPKPRLFRIPGKGALINRMGFNNSGIDSLLKNIHRQTYQAILGINIGKQMSTNVEDALQDYLIGLKKAFPVADYVAINISSPNTPNLRQLQKREALEELLKGLTEVHNELCLANKARKPLVLKVAPDLDESEIEEIAKLLIKYRIDGLIATNTTIARNGVEGIPQAKEKGGLSGAPLTRRSTDIVRQFHHYLKDEIPIIAAGGIMSGEDALDKINAGAALVQIYTGFIYRGPALIKEILKAIQPIAS